MTNENDKLRLYEVAFSYEVTGTILVLASDPSKATAKVEEILHDSPDPDLFQESDILWPNDDVTPILKDELRGILTLEAPQHSTYDIYTAGREGEFDEAELDLLDDSQFTAAEGDPEVQDKNKPFDENNDGIDKPGDDRAIPRHPTPPSASPGPAIGMTGSRDLPRSAPTPSAPPRNPLRPNPTPPATPPKK